MHLPTIITAAFAALALAAPEPKHYHGVGLFFIVKNSTGPNNFYEPAPIEINVLANTGKGGAVKLEFDEGTAVNVDINSIECRAYKDKWGFKPLAVFTNKKPAVLGDGKENVGVGSILCYVT